MAESDYVIIGSGINALVAAVLLGKKGRKVTIIERNSEIGGCLRTEEITLPGYRHDVMATTMVLFLTSPAYAAIGKDLEARGLEFCHSPLPTGVVRTDGSHAILSMDRAQNIMRFNALGDGDGAAFDREMGRFADNAGFVFGLLGGNLWSAATVKLIAKEVWKKGIRGLLTFLGEALAPARGYLETTYRSEEMRALFAPWALHCGLGPESAYSAEMVRVIGFAIEAAGCPIVKGGAANLVASFERLILDQGSEILRESDVERILVDGDGRATGIQLKSGKTVTASRGVIASVTPHQLYQRLLKDAPKATPPEVADGLRGYRYGKGNMQIHYALKAPPRWRSGSDLAKVALLHLAAGLDGVSRSANEAECGLLPTEPTVCIGQPTALDPSRAPAGGSILWLQLPDTPRQIKGDAAGLLDCPADGNWTETIREAFADRVEAILRKHIENFDDIVLARRSYSPKDLEAMNVNLVGGDPYGGFCGVDQFFVWRPFKSTVNHRTHIDRLHHIGASTHPGPGLAGGSGYLLGSSLK